MFHSGFILTDKLSFTRGLCYTDESKCFEGRQRNLNLTAPKLCAPAEWYLIVPIHVLAS